MAMSSQKSLGLLQSQRQVYKKRPTSWYLYIISLPSEDHLLTVQALFNSLSTAQSVSNPFKHPHRTEAFSNLTRSPSTMHASYLSLAFFATVALTAPVADNTISGSGGVFVNGQPLPPDSCVIGGVITPAAQCPTLPSSGLICFPDGKLMTGPDCAGKADVVDLGPPARLAKRAGPTNAFVLDCKGGLGAGTPSDFTPINQACLAKDGQIILYFYCTAAEFPTLKCTNPQPIPGKPFPYPVNT